jgi:hydroxyacylglutathione hydrolase
MSTDIFSMKLGINRCYLIRGGKGIVMVDCGMPNKLRVFEKALSGYNISPGEIKLIVLTHAHFDHMGCARGIKLFTGAKLATHENEKVFMEEGRFTWPKGVTSWGKFSRIIILPYFKTIPITKAKVDIVLTDSGYPLIDFGIDGSVIFTPGYSSGSVSVLLKTGEAFVGNLAHNGFPYRNTPGLPIFAEDIDKIKESWKLLIEKGARMIYPGHGDPFSIAEIKQYLS